MHNKLIKIYWFSMTISLMLLLFLLTIRVEQGYSKTAIWIINEVSPSAHNQHGQYNGHRLIKKRNWKDCSSRISLAYTDMESKSWTVYARYYLTLLAIRLISQNVWIWLSWPVFPLQMVLCAFNAHHCYLISFLKD